MKGKYLKIESYLDLWQQKYMNSLGRYITYISTARVEVMDTMG
jgi:hypothetical protein